MFLRRLTGPLLSKFKESTGIVGVDVVPNAREVLIGLYNETLKAVKVIPEDAVYRQSVEKFTNHRLKVCVEENEWDQIEKKIGNGQVEELILQAKDELELIPKIAGKTQLLNRQKISIYKKFIIPVVPFCSCIDKNGLLTTNFCVLLLQSGNHGRSQKVIKWNLK